MGRAEKSEIVERFAVVDYNKGKMMTVSRTREQIGQPQRELQREIAQLTKGHAYEQRRILAETATLKAQLKRLQEKRNSMMQKKVRVKRQSQDSKRLEGDSSEHYDVDKMDRVDIMRMLAQARDVVHDQAPSSKRGSLSSTTSVVLSKHKPHEASISKAYHAAKGSPTEAAELQDWRLDVFLDADDKLTGFDQLSEDDMKKWARPEIPQYEDLDINSLREVAILLKEAKAYQNSKRIVVAGGGMPEITNERRQTRRLMQMEKILQGLKDGPVTIATRNREKMEALMSPGSVLSCKYLRLSKKKVLELEGFLRARGISPGIHAHKDVTNYNIWSGDSDSILPSSSQLRLKPVIEDGSTHSLLESITEVHHINPPKTVVQRQSKEKAVRIASN